MGLFKKKTDLDEIKDYLKNSFSHVKKDTQKLFAWITHLHQQNLQQQTLIQNLQADLQEHQKQDLDPQEIKKIIDSYYSYDQIHQRIEHLNKKLGLLASMHDNHGSFIQNLKDKFETVHQKVTEIAQKKEDRPSIKEKLAQKITKNSKQYVKTIILSTINKYKEVPALKLKEMIVDEQGLCSKSSFYRLLKELEDEQDLDYVQEGRQKIYYPKLLKRE